ncbi:hypothetical protein [uncultured Acidaminococcus sp.]|jgi:hypothetical protein|uniref:hypothetical protein n=1 Tax=uncultured Acidaminococcus sp. TaxID=352152 RepID=UPI002674CD70|nr:hypothetical protein [uncultured Acidaminococcus sp.]
MNGFDLHPIESRRDASRGLDLTKMELFFKMDDCDLRRYGSCPLDKKTSRLKEAGS